MLFCTLSSHKKHAFLNVLRLAKAKHSCLEFCTSSPSALWSKLDHIASFIMMQWSDLRICQFLVPSGWKFYKFYFMLLDFGFMLEKLHYLAFILQIDLCKFFYMFFGVRFICFIYFLQNKILHSRLEALHIQSAEKDRNSVGVSSGSTSTDTLGDTGLHNIINYLRRPKEIVSFFFHPTVLSISR